MMLQNCCQSHTYIVLPKGLTAYTKPILCPCPNLLEGEVHILRDLLIYQRSNPWNATPGECFLHFILYHFLPYSVMASLDLSVP